MLRDIAHALGLTNAAKFEKIVSNDRRKNPEIFENADRILKKFQGGGGFVWSEGGLQPYKLVSLSRRLDALEPKSVLELGSGSSTVILGQWAKKTGAKVISVDENDSWLENTRSMLNYFKVQEHVELIKSAKELDPTKLEARYEVGDLAAELVLIDGPALELDGKEYKKSVCTDIFTIDRPKYILVDMRLPTVAAIQERLPFYSCQSSDRVTNTFRDDFFYFSEFRQSEGA